MSTTTDEIETALDACDGVEHIETATHGEGDVKHTVYFADGVDSTAPLSGVLAEYDLRIWYVSFKLRSMMLVPASVMDYPELRPVSDGSESREGETLADRIERTELSEDPFGRPEGGRTQ